MDWLQSAAAGELADAQYELGRLHIHGNQKLGVEKNIQKARQWWEKAAGNDHGGAMKELSWRYAQAADGFPWDLSRAKALHEKIAEGYRLGCYGLPLNHHRSSDRRQRAEEIKALKDDIENDDPETLATLGRQLLRSKNASSQGLKLLEKAALQGDPQIQYEMGAIYLFGRHGIARDLEKGRQWWNRALVQKHVKTMEMVAPAYRNGNFGYAADLLKSRALVELLVEAYRDGRYGVDPDPKKERYWTAELKHFKRLFDMAGGNYLPLDELRKQATAGDLRAQYQLGRQMLIAGAAGERQKGLQWIERAAEGGYAEAQYRLVVYYENQLHIMRDDPSRGVALLKSAAEQNHLRAMSYLALAYEKGRYHLVKDYQQSQYWYGKLLQAYDSGQYLSEVDERFISFQRRRLEMVTKVGQALENRARRYEQATDLERQIMEIEDRYRLEFERAVNGLDRRDGSRRGQKRFREKVDQLRQKYTRQRELEIERIKHQAAEKLRPDL
jgi:hypothetical protein